MNPFAGAAPGRFHYGLWYTFLLLWMQGEALLNSLWGLLLLLSLPWLRGALARIADCRALRYAVAAYLLIRLSSLAFALSPKAALYGITDDLRIFSIGVLALLYLRDRRELLRALTLSLIGFTSLAWWALGLYWHEHHSLSASTSGLEFGSLASVNYSATFAVVLLFALLAALPQLPRRWLPLAFAFVIPIALLQGPQSSRTAVIAFAVALLPLLLLRRSLRTFATAILFAGLTLFTYSTTPGGYAQFGEVAHAHQSNSLQIRFDIWATLFRVWQEHPLGIGPGGFNSIDMNDYRDWIAAHVPHTAGEYYGSDALANGLQGIDLNSAHFVTDAHSFYVALFTENGPHGLLAFLAILAALALLALRDLRHADAWRATLAIALVGALLIMSLSALMLSVYTQSGGVIMALLAGMFLAARSLSDEANA